MQSVLDFIILPPIVLPARKTKQNKIHTHTKPKQKQKTTNQSPPPPTHLQANVFFKTLILLLDRLAELPLILMILKCRLDRI